MSIRKAVIPAAGLGTRFLPITKTIPKEMLPLIDRPMIHYTVSDAVASGMEQVIIVTGRGKDTLRDYFAPSPGLEVWLQKKKEAELLSVIRGLSRMAHISYVRQEQPLGLGHAVLTAQPAVGDEPFAVLLPDVIMQAEESSLVRMLPIFQSTGSSVICVAEVTPQEIPAYGIIDPQEVEPGLYKVKGVVEKPSISAAPSNLGIVGQYIFTPEIFQALQQVKPGAKGEIQLTDGIGQLLRSQEVYAWRFQGVRYDVGNPLGLFKASISLALRDENLGPDLRLYLKDILEKNL